MYTSIINIDRTNLPENEMKLMLLMITDFKYDLKFLGYEVRLHRCYDACGNSLNAVGHSCNLKIKYALKRML